MQVRIQLDKYLKRNRKRLIEKSGSEDEEQLLELARSELHARKLHQHLNELEERNRVVLLIDIDKDLDKAAYKKIRDEDED